MSRFSHSAPWRPAACLQLERLEDRTLLDCTRVLSGLNTFPTLTIPAGETWCFDPTTNTTVESTGNVVLLGTLIMLPADPAIVHTMRFTGANEAAYVGGGMEVLPSDVGLWVMDAGQLFLVGAEKLGWARAAGAVAQGATQITLDADPVGWRVGDEISVAPTGPDGHTQFDLRTIAAIAGRTITLNTGTTHAHPAVTIPDGRTFTSEVMNLTRNVRVEGRPPQFEFPRPGQVNTAGRAHVFIHNTVPTTQIIAYAAIRHMGPRQVAGQYSASVLGRYGLHFHMSGDNNRGSIVLGTVIRDTGGHAYVPHESNGVVFWDTVSYNTADDAYWWDLRTPTQDTFWGHAIAALVKTDPPFRGYRLTGFALGAGGGNVVFDSVAVGVQGNEDASGFEWPEGSSSVWTFLGNVAHNNKENGIFVWQNTASAHVVPDFVAYHNGGAGIDHGAYNNAYVYDRITLYRNAGGAASNDAGVVLHAVSQPSGAEGALTFRDLTVDMAGAAPAALHITSHNLPASNRGRLVRWAVAGYTDRAVLVNESNGNRGWYDFICWTVDGSRELEPTDFRLTRMAPESLLRVQRRDGTAYQIDAAFQVTPIPAFAACDGGALAGRGTPIRAGADVVRDLLPTVSEPRDVGGPVGGLLARPWQVPDFMAEQGRSRADRTDLAEALARHRPARGRSDLAAVLLRSTAASEFPTSEF